MQRNQANSSSSDQISLPNFASQMRAAFASMASNTGSSAPGEIRDDVQHFGGRRLLLQRLGKLLARQSARACILQAAVPDRCAACPSGQRPYPPSFRSNEDRRLRVRLFAPLRDKVTSSAQSLVPFRSGPAKDRASSILTEPHDELAPSHSITSSARASSVGGTSRPSALAVLRLITSSYLVGACTGRSAGFSPLRMRST